MEVSIILKGIAFTGDQRMPTHRRAIVAFEIDSDDVGTIAFNVDFVPEKDDPRGIDGAVMIARKTLIEFGKALVSAGEEYEPPVIYSPKSGRDDLG